MFGLFGQSEALTNVAPHANHVSISLNINTRQNPCHCCFPESVASKRHWHCFCGHPGWLHGRLINQSSKQSFIYPCNVPRTVISSFKKYAHDKDKDKVCPNCNWASQEDSSVPALNSGFRSMKRLGVFLLPLDGILVHRRLPPSILSRVSQAICWFSFIHLGGERHSDS